MYNPLDPRNERPENGTPDITALWQSAAIHSLESYLTCGAIEAPIHRLKPDEIVRIMEDPALDGRVEYVTMPRVITHDRCSQIAIADERYQELLEGPHARLAAATTFHEFQIPPLLHTLREDFATRLSLPDPQIFIRGGAVSVGDAIDVDRAMPALRIKTLAEMLIDGGELPRQERLTMVVPFDGRALHPRPEYYLLYSVDSLRAATAREQRGCIFPALFVYDGAHLAHTGNPYEVILPDNDKARRSALLGIYILDYIEPFKLPGQRS